MRGNYMSMKMFEKAKIGNVELKNRLGNSAMGVSHTDADGSYSDRLIDYYVERAKGGYGLIFPAGAKVTDRFEPSNFPNMFCNPHHAVRTGILCNRLHQYGAKFCLQLTIGAGRVSSPTQLWGGARPKSASAVPLHWEPSIICEPYTKDEIAFMVDEFGKASKLAKDVGVDIIEIHAYGGYLIDQFISAQWNHREDEYGGSMENRLRLLIELKDAVRAYCGDDFPVIAKITPDHGYEGGRTLEEGIEMLKYLDDKGFDGWHLDYGCYEAWYNCIPTVYQEMGTQIFMAKAIKEAGIKTPILLNGKLNDPKLAEKVLEDGTADFILHGHQSIADPYWPKKVKHGKFEDIRYCIGCNECLLTDFINRPFHCAVNPVTAFEEDYKLTPAPEKKSVLVIGGGPAGMQAALTAKERGLDVELWEKELELGGNMRAAGKPVFKESVIKYMNYMKTQIYKAGIPVQLNKCASAEDVLAKKPDAVILAGGSLPIIPRIEGLDKIQCLEAVDLLKNDRETGDKVVVLGGGIIGCETALHLDSIGKEVTIVEMAGKLIPRDDQCANNDAYIRKMLAESSIKVMTSSKLEKADKDGVRVSTGGETIYIPCDTVVIAVGRKTDSTLEDALIGRIDKVFRVGENLSAPGKILNAVNEAYHTIRLLEELEN